MESQLLTKKIRLICVIGHGIDLLEHFILHYKKCVDEINFVVYETEDDQNLYEKVNNVINNHSDVFIVKRIKERKFDWEKVTELYNEIKQSNPDQWWVVADIDEFHLYPNDNLIDLISECEDNGWDIVRGGFIDRIGPNGEFVQYEKERSIWEQFPNAGFFRHPMSFACPNKVCVMKGYVEVTPGQHYAKINGQTTWKWQGWNHPLINPNSTVQVHHFKWDNTSIQRIRNVASINKEYAYSEEYRLMYKELSKVKYKIDLTNSEYMFECNLIKPKYELYKNWNKLINKIKSV